MNTRIDLVKHITPVLTHDGRILARFSDRETARRMCWAWGGCVLGATHTDPGTLTLDRAPGWTYGAPFQLSNRMTHPDRPTGPVHPWAYCPDASEWMCRTCDTATDYCTNPHGH